MAALIVVLGTVTYGMALCFSALFCTRSIFTYSHSTVIISLSTSPHRILVNYLFIYLSPACNSLGTNKSAQDWFVSSRERACMCVEGSDFGIEQTKNYDLLIIL